MDEPRPTRRIRNLPLSNPAAALMDEADLWMGGEASLGTQARQYIRRSERNTPGFAMMILGLTFLGGVALGTVVSPLLRKTRR